MDDCAVRKGRRAEQLAREYLESAGLRHVCSNWHDSHREIDIIMEDDGFLHIIEVRSLMTPSFHHPYETVGRKKRISTIMAARRFVARHSIEKEIVFDIVSILYGQDGNVLSIQYIPRAFGPDQEL